MGDPVPYAFLKNLRIRNTIVREFLGEFLGTFILVLIGDAAFAQTVLEGRKVDDVFAVVWAWGVAVMLGVATCGNITGGHINPAVTVAFATLGKFPWRKVGHFLLAQHLGAFVASAVLFANYKDFLDHFDPNRTITGETATAHIWATYPKPFVSLLSCFVDQVVGTGLLMFTALAIIDKRNLNIPAWMHPICLGFMISAVAMCFGANCMAPLNPARDFATRCFTAVAGYGADVFTYRNYWWVGLIGPHVGAIVGGWLYYLGIELHWPNEREDHLGDHELTTALNSGSGSSNPLLHSSPPYALHSAMGSTDYGSFRKPMYDSGTREVKSAPKPRWVNPGTIPTGGNPPPPIGERRNGPRSPLRSSGTYFARSRKETPHSP